MRSIKIVAEIAVKAQFREALLPVLKNLVEGSRAEAGNLSYDLTENIERAGHFFVLEEWASEQAIATHNATPHFQAFVAAIDGKTDKLAIVKAGSVF